MPYPSIYVCRDDIVKWIVRKAGPPAATLVSDSDLDAVRAKPSTLVAYFDKFEVIPSFDPI